MKEAILIILHSIFLLAVRGSTYQCPDCIIPCVANSIPNITNSYLLQTFYHQIRDHTLLTFLDAINGDVRFMSSNGREVFTKTISIATNGYTMSELCSIFSNAPRLLRTSPYPKIKFRYFPTYLLSDVDESGNFYLFEKMSLLLVEQRDVIVQLRDVKSDFDILNYTVYDNVESFREVSHDLIGVESKCDLQHETTQTDISTLKHTIREVEVDNDALLQKIEMRKKLEYAMLDAYVYGTSFECRPSDYRFQFPVTSKDSRNCRVDYPNWMYFRLIQEFEFNVIQMYHWDGDSRVFTYSIDISRDRISWTSLVVNQKGQGLVIHRFSQTYTARYLRMKGYNTVNVHFAIYWLKLDLI